MKKMLLTFGLLLLSVTLAFGDVVSIASIQDTTGTGSDASALAGQVVTVEGIISAESGAFGGSKYFIQDAEAKWSGIMVYGDYDRGNAYGDSVRITATVTEYSGLTELTNVTEYVKLDSGKTVNPIEVTTGEVGTGGAEAEAYEGVLVKVVDAEITQDANGYGEWYINDGTGEVQVDDAADYYFTPSEYDSVESIVGVMSYSYSNCELFPRLAWDIVETSEYVRIQRVQQVRVSDLKKAYYDAESDTSYMKGDTVKVKGIVTMPTGLSYAGDGIKFLFQQEGGGPWSSLMSYNPDSTAYPQLFEGDVIEMSGYIEEYGTGDANMTEFFITSPINILNYGVELPAADTVTTGDLQLPITAEQYGTNIVVVKNAVVTDLMDGEYELFKLDDGTGGVLVDDDSDSLGGYPDPALGSIMETARGWLYHHYGAHSDSNTYKLCPLYVEDLVLGAGPPQLQNIARTPGVPYSSDEVFVSINVVTNGTISSVDILYSVDGGALQTATMTNEEGNVYSGSIPAQANGSFVEYFVKAVDTDAQESMYPSDTSAYKYGYKIVDEGLTISDVQYSPWSIANSPFNECNVELIGIVTTDTAFNNAYDAHFIQDAAGAWNGIAVFGAETMLERGDQVIVYGQVHEQNPDWTYKWGNNTVLLADSIKVFSQGNDVPAPVVVTTAELDGDSETAEQYEGCLVKIEDIQVTALNSYDWSVDDGSGSCLIDDDAAGGALETWFDSLAVGTTVDYVQGPFVYSFGSYKVTPRDLQDVAEDVGIADNPIREAYTYKLRQNYPNPFNPDTRIAFEIPQTADVKIIIYNVLGQKVRTLTSQSYSAGYHILNWDARSDAGCLVSSGTYIMRMISGDFVQTRKMVLIR